ncbi:MAG: hypothetical protein ABR538_00330 [Candidatus Binatia bacterium]
MQTPSPAILELARCLVAASRTSSDPGTHELCSVVGKLRISLTRVAGVEGFSSLLRRAVMLAALERPSLKGLQVDPDGHLQGTELLPVQDGAGSRAETATIVTAQLLELLVTFIGEALTRMLLREAWPDTHLYDTNSGSEADE